jgi:succinate-acetate transporter protein
MTNDLQQGDVRQESAVTELAAAEPTPSATPNPLHGNPGTVGLPTVIAGAVGLGLVNAGYFPGGALGATVAILMAATSVGLLVATVWAAALGQNAAASLFAVFLGFYASYVALVLGLGHGWYGAVSDDGVEMIATWIICWLVAMVILTLVTVRLPWSFTLLLVLVDAALVLLLIGTLGAATAFTRAGSVVVFLFIAVAVYLYADIMSRETGGRGLPLGRPVRQT